MGSRELSSQIFLPRRFFLLLSFLCASFFVASPAFALEIVSGDYVLIDEPINDTIFGSGGVIEINAPIEGAVIAGGSVYLNGPVYGDVFVLAGEVVVNSEIHGDLVGVAGKLDVGGNIEDNAVLVGLSVDFHENSTVERDLLVSGGTITNEGELLGNVTVSGGDFENDGYVGSVEVKENVVISRLTFLSKIMNVLLMSGFLLVGVFLLFLYPEGYRRADAEIRRAPLRVTLTGFALLFASPFVILLFLMSLIGIPLAFVLAVSYLLSLLAALVIVSYTLGHYLLESFGLRTGAFWGFVLGLLVLNLLYRIPYLGLVFILVTLCLGSGAVYYALQKGLSERRGIAERLRDLLKIPHRYREDLENSYKKAGSRLK